MTGEFETSLLLGMVPAGRTGEHQSGAAEVLDLAAPKHKGVACGQKESDRLHSSEGGGYL